LQHDRLSTRHSRSKRRKVQIGVALVLLWVLATLGIIAIAGLSSMLVIAIIVGLIATMFGGRRRSAEPI
jgi:hypothetical protein